MLDSALPEKNARELGAAVFGNNANIVRAGVAIAVAIRLARATNVLGERAHLISVAEGVALALVHGLIVARGSKRYLSGALAGRAEVCFIQRTIFARGARVPYAVVTRAARGQWLLAARIPIRRRITRRTYRDAYETGNAPLARTRLAFLRTGHAHTINRNRALTHDRA